MFRLFSLVLCTTMVVAIMAAPKRYVQSPVVLSNSDWQPLIVFEDPMEISMPSEPKRQARKVPKVSKKAYNIDTIGIDDPFLAPTALPEYKVPVQVRRKKESSGYKKQPSKSQQIKIISHNKKVSQKDNKAYHFDFESENGITRTEDGYLKSVESSKYPAQVMSGSYSYTGPDGNVYTITYVADENGYRAEGSHLPVPPAGK